MAAAAPSLIGEHIGSVSGYVIGAAVRTCSTVYASRYCASGLCTECAWFFADTAAAHRGVDIHEHAVRLGRHAARRWLDPTAHAQQPLPPELGVVHVPSAIERAEAARLVGRVHLLCADGQHNVGGAGAHVGHRQVESGAGARAGVLDVDDRETTDVAERKLAANHVLPVHVALRGVAEERTLQRGRFALRVGERLLHNLAGQLLDAGVHVLTEWRHADAGDEDRSAHGDLLKPQTLLISCVR